MARRAPKFRPNGDVVVRYRRHGHAFYTPEFTPEFGANDRVRPDTAAHYVAHARTLILAGQVFPASTLTASTVAKWLATRTAFRRSASLERP